MRLKIILLFALLVTSSIAVIAQGGGQQVVVDNGRMHPVAGRDRLRRADEIVYYTPAYYKKNPPHQSGLDILVKDGKVAEVQDLAGAVYIQKKADPGPIKDLQGDFILSGTGTARRWMLENLKPGIAVRVTDAPKLNANGEVPPEASIPCFPGAFYRKAVTSFDSWTGIAGIVKLGDPRVDMDRLHSERKTPLDNFSVYMGGRAGVQEIDAGLTWSFSTDEAGNPSKVRNVFRPFWRNDKWHNAPPEERYFWRPGDTVQIAVMVAGPKKLKMIIADATPNPKKFFETEFDAAGFDSNIPRQFKRVNAIDQVANEGKPAQPTKAQVTAAEWLQTVLFRGAGADAKQVPMDQKSFTDMRCPSESMIVVTPTDAAKGAEKIDIFGLPVEK